jgi:hypothetical protein
MANQSHNITPNREAVAFVGSSLPAKILYDQIKSGEVKTIYASHPRLLESYQHLISKCNKTINLKCVYENKSYNNIFKMIYLLFLIKTRRKYIYIYHECCWQMLDICIWLTRPLGFYLPQVNTKNIFKPVANCKTFYNYRSFFVASKMSLYSILFNYYYFTNGDKKGIEFVPVIKKYPKSILIRNESKIIPNLYNKTKLKIKKILILAGTDCASSQELIEVFDNIIRKALEFKYIVAIKNHPNVESRINLNIKEVEIIDPLIPAEILEDDFTIVVGTASAAMVTFGHRSVSILNLLSTISDEDRKIRIEFIQELNKSVKLINNINEIFI